PYETLYPGYKYNMIDLLAALGIHQVDKIGSSLKIREKYWKLYDNAFKEIKEITTPQEPPKYIKHARHLYTILLKENRLKINRNQFVDALKAENIGAGIHFTPLHLHKYYREAFGYKKGAFPNAEHIGDRTISLPLSPVLSMKDITDVIKAVTKLVNYYKK
ncbi:MAG: DegT/DnrJ/EryC1/StrS family aminotransferase, partial [Actinobacteria bacterium]|nr:DegT/DnrJ/EryC1/StrS family aminotransferase [Actinomycetota bacterium]